MRVTPAVDSSPAQAEAPSPGAIAERAALSGWLSACVGDPEQFLAESWATRPHLQRTAGFAGDFGVDQVIRMLDMGIVGAGDIAMVRRGLSVPSHMFACREGHVVTLGGVLTTRLQPGDSLYLPRGYVNNDTSAGFSSAHLSVGRPSSLGDLLAYAVKKLAATPGLAQPLGFGFASRPNQLPAALHKAGRLLSEHLSDLAVLEDIVHGFCRSQGPAQRGGLPR